MTDIDFLEIKKDSEICVTNKKSEQTNVNIFCYKDDAPFGADGYQKNIIQYTPVKVQKGTKPW